MVVFGSGAVHPWVPVLVTITLGVAGLGVQGLLLAFFLGRMKAHQEGQAQLISAFQTFTEKAIDTLTDRMARADDLASAANADRAGLDARLKSVEQSTDGLPKFREDFAAFEATARAHHRRVEADLARIHSGMESLQRQVGQLAIHGPGRLVEMASSK